jgi:putative protease
MKKIELLSPAGSMDALKAAAAAGCDAVYLGLTSFSARAFAGNFSHEEFSEAIQYCHVRGISVYVTINTMLFEKEIENAKKEIDFLYHHDCDGVLIQDLGLFHYVRTCYPDFPVHCSTQMHIHNLAGVKYMKDEGASRVVMARETPIELVKQAADTGMDVEVFVYGAICISYSGQCLMSAAAKNRSANRGMCAQCCRLKYYPKQAQHFKEGDYILSPKDLNVIERLPEIISAGTASLKIEGRMKRPEYVYLVTKTYREAIDAYYRHEEYHVSKQRQRELLMMFNRGFSEGHLFHADAEHRMSQFRPNHQGVEIGRVLEAELGSVTVKLSAPLYQHDGLRIIHNPEDIGLTAVKIEKNGRLVNKAGEGETVKLSCHGEVLPKRGDSLHKTSDTKLLKKIDDAIAKGMKKPIAAEYTAAEGKAFKIIFKDENGLIGEAESEQVCEKARNAAVDDIRIQQSIQKTGEDPYTVINIQGHAENIFLPVSVMNDTRRRALEMLNRKRAVRYTRKNALPYSLQLQKPEEPAYRLLVLSEEDNVEVPAHTALYTPGYGTYHYVPAVDENLEEKTDYTECILSSAGNLYGKQNGTIAGMTMNAANSYAAAYLLSKGIASIILSSEMNEEEIRDMSNAFEKRYGFRPYLYQLVYGKRTVMYIKDTFLKDLNTRTLEDLHGNYYPLRQKGGITEILEADCVHRENACCYGSAVILRKDTEDKKGIMKEAYEELYR